MTRISDEKIFAILLGFPSIYLYLSSLNQFFSYILVLKNILFLMTFVIGAFSYTRILRKKKNIILFHIIIIIIIINIIFKPEFLEYFVDVNTIVGIMTSDLISLFFISIPAFLISLNENNYSLLLEELYNIGIIINIFFIIAFFLVVFIFKVNFDYMNFTYGVIPWVYYVFVNSLYKKKIIVFLISIITFSFIIISGCRGAVLSSIVFIILLYIGEFCNNFTKNKLLLLLLLLLLSVIIFFNLENIILYLYEKFSSVGFQSRTLELYLDLGYEKGLNHYSDRFVLQAPLIENLNILGYGLYGDRMLINGNYAHNVLLEWVVDFGYLGGGILCWIFIFKVIKVMKILFFHKGNKNIIIFGATCISILCCKYMFSSSYIHAPEFWALFGLMIALKEKNDKIIIVKNICRMH